MTDLHTTTLEAARQAIYELTPGYIDRASRVDAAARFADAAHAAVLEAVVRATEAVGNADGTGGSTPMSFVTEEAVDAACDAWERTAGTRRGMMRNALEADAPIWLAHVQRASEHTADYRIAEAAAELRRLATTTDIDADAGKLPTWADPVWHRGFRIYYDRTPVAGNDWHYVHDDYDGAEDAGDNRAGSETTLEACKIEIDERFFDGVRATTEGETT